MSHIHVIKFLGISKFDRQPRQEQFMSKSIKTNIKANSFNQAYEGTDMYYGWEVRPEFNDFFSNVSLEGCRVLDLGAGEGRYAIYLAGKGGTVTAVDFSASGLNKLKIIADEHQLSVTTELCDVSKYEFKENDFDLVVAATILDHLETPVRNRTVDGIIKSLKPGGLLYVNVFTTEDPGYHADGANTQEGISDTSFGMAHYYGTGELKDCFSPLTTIYYYEGVEEDVSHGQTGL